MASSKRAGSERRPAPKASNRAAVPPARAGDPAGPLVRRLAFAALIGTVVLTPLVFDADSRDSFRIPKALFFGLGALVSLFLLSLTWKAPADLARLARTGSLRAIGPFVAVATAVSLLSPHVEHVHRGLAGVWVGGLALWGWSAGFTRRELHRALRWTLLPAGLLGLVGALQFHDLFQPFHFAALRDASRLAITSFAGNAGDLSAFLVLPALVAQRLLALGQKRLLAVAALCLAFYGIAITQTFAAAAALAAGTLLFWAPVLPARRRWLAAGSAAVVMLLALAVSTPFRARAVEKLREIARGDWNEVLTGRFDGWRAGVWMLREHPWSGVGAGAFRTEFLPAKEALIDRGVTFFEQQQNVVFANAHNEVVETGAELGIFGLLALGWAIFEALRRCRDLARAAATAGLEAPGFRRRAADAGLAWGGCAALATLSMFHFPFRIAIVAAPAILFLAWLWSSPEEAA
jgi:O-antigen ligase